MPQGRRSVSDHRRRAPLARRASAPACCACRSSSASRARQERSLLEMALIENIQRENLNPIDEALAYRRLADEFHLTQEDIADGRRQGPRVGRQLPAAAEAARTRSAPRSPPAACRWATRARCSRSTDEAEQRSVARDVIARSLSVRETESLVKNDRRRRAAPTAQPRAPKPVDVHTRAAEDAAARCSARASASSARAPRPDRDRFRLGGRADSDLRAAD